MVTVGLFVRLEAKPGKEQDVEALLGSSLDVVQAEPATAAWFAFRFGSRSFGIFDVFPDEPGRQAHLAGRVVVSAASRDCRLWLRRTRVCQVVTRAGIVCGNPARNRGAVPGSDVVGPRRPHTTERLVAVMSISHYVEHAIDSTSCPSPVGLCIEGDYSGAIRGAFVSTATSLAPTADTPTTAVVSFTGDGTIHASVDGGHGDLYFKSAGAFHTVGRCEIVDLQFITRGSGAFAGASGTLRASGTFDPIAGMGESEFSGNICIP